jgi:hypothetical protein
MTIAKTHSKPRGFQTLPPERMAEIASLGGRTAHRKGAAHQWTSEEAREAARKSVEVRQAKIEKATRY